MSRSFHYPVRRLTSSMVSLGSIGNPLARLARWLRRQEAADPDCGRLNLALQGGGAHGAFTWGVLDALLADTKLEFHALSGSSAGAINAVVMTHGWLHGGRDGARQALSDFWVEVGKQIPWSMMTHGSGESISLTQATKMLANWVGMFAPSSFNPLAINPLGDLLSRTIDFDKLRSNSPFKLFVGATHVNTGKLRLFREHELTVEMLLASACLPKIHHTVLIDNEPYWDGGYSANPAIFPLIQDEGSHDVLLVLLAPRVHEATPQTMEAIESRIQELGFKTHFLREMQMHALLRNAQKAFGYRKGSLGSHKEPTRFHLIDSNHLHVVQRSETKLLASPPFLEMLRDQGREQSKSWILQHAASVGKHSTVDLAQWLN